MKQKTWAIVADGATARILKDVGASRIGEEIALHADSKPLGEIMADSAGRSFSSTGARRSAMELHSDPVRDNERAFARLIADSLAEHLAAEEFELLVFAAPRTLGDLRNAFSDTIKQVVVKEVDKNLTNLPRKELWETVGALLRP